MSEENIKTLIKKRGILKASFTRICIAITNLDFPETHFLKVKLRNLKELGDKYDDVQSEVEYLAKESDPVSEKRIKIEEVLFATDCKILKLLDNPRNADDGNVANHNVHLEPIKIPIFNGNVLEWQH